MGWQGMGRQAPRRRVSNPFEPLNNQQSPTSPDGQHSELANGHFNGFGGGGGSKKVLTVQELNAKREAIFQKELEGFKMSQRLCLTVTWPRPKNERTFFTTNRSLV